MPAADELEIRLKAERRNTKYKRQNTKDKLQMTKTKHKSVLDACCR